jgi:hypothetical protein
MKRTWITKSIDLSVAEVTDIPLRDKLMREKGLDPTKKFLQRRLGRGAFIVQWQEITNAHAIREPVVLPCTGPLDLHTD